MKILNSSVHIDDFGAYHDADLVDVAKRRGIYASEVQDAIVELDKQGIELYTMAITDDPQAMEKGIDVIFATNRGNFVWHPDQEFELVENVPKYDYSNDPDNMTFNRRGFKGKTAWDFLSRGLEETYNVYEGNKEVQEHRQETVKSEKNRYALAIKNAFLNEIEDSDDVAWAKRYIWVNPRANDIGLKFGQTAVDSLPGSFEQAYDIIKHTANMLGIDVDIKEYPVMYGRKAIMVSVPYYRKSTKK